MKHIKWWIFYKKHHFPHKKELLYIKNKLINRFGFETTNKIFTPNERKVLHLYTRLGESLEDIGTKISYGVTSERIRQILCKIKRKMKYRLKE